MPRYLSNNTTLFSPLYWAPLCLVYLLISAHSAQASVYEQAQAGQLVTRSHNEQDFQPALHLQSRANFQISGMIAHVELEQSFRNDSENWVAGQYLFPLPESAAVNAMRIRVGERVIVGEIQEKQQAEKTYKAAKKAGKLAGLVTQQRPNLFTQDIANIAPGETVTVSISYLHSVEYQDGRFSLRFPMTLTPRYIPGAPLLSAANTVTEDQDSDGFENTDATVSSEKKAQLHHPVKLGAFGWSLPTDQVPDAHTITPPMRKMNQYQPQDSHGIELNVTLNSGLPIANINSAYHDILVTRQGDQHQVRLRKQSVPMDRDFDLSWQPVSGTAPQAALFTEEVEGDHYALLMLLPPQQGMRSTKLPREVVFVLDTSGSMSGTSIQQAKQALQLALRRLEPSDRFNLIEFDSYHRQLYSQPMPATAENISDAIRFVRNLRADGGTEMASALNAALTHTSQSEHIRQVVFITDGSVGNEAALFKLIRNQLGDARLFTVGIGSAPNSYFMRKAAEFGRGTFTYIGDTAEVQSKMIELFSKLEKPVMRGLQLNWPADIAVESWPAQIPDLYHGEPLVITAKLDKLHGTLRVSGERALSTAETNVGPSQAWKSELPLSSHTLNKGISTLWAREKIESLEDDKVAGADPSRIRNEVLQVALTHQLVSPYTSFVAVEQQISRPTQEPLSEHAVPNLVAKGQKLQVAYPSTASTAPLHLMFAALASLFAVCLLLFTSQPRPNKHRGAKR